MKKLYFLLWTVIFSFQLSAQQFSTFKLVSKNQQQPFPAEMAGDFSQPINFTVDLKSSVAHWEMPEDSSGNSTLDHFNLYLDGTFISEVATDERSYFYDCLNYGQNYTAGISAVYDWGETEMVNYNFTSAFLFPPRNLEGSSTYGNATITISFDAPMNCEGEVPAGLISFNIYEDWDLIGNIPYDEEYFFVDYDHSPGTYSFCLSAVYDLSAFGFPGQTGESAGVCDTTEVIWGFELPFYESWYYGNFEFNDWYISSSNWKINTEEGHPSPSAEFTKDPQPFGESYTLSLISPPLDAYLLTVGDIWLDFELKLDDANANGTEKMKVNVYNGENWNNVYERKNEGSFEWDSIHLNITDYAMENVFRIQFEAAGENTYNIEKWMIDNIEVYRTCRSACDLAIEVDTVGDDEYLVNFTWQSCEPPPPNNWIHWDDGTNFTGVGSTCDCATSVAARWPANTFPEYQGTDITKVRVFASDEGYTSWVIKIWSGENADSLLYAEDVTSQIIAGTWTEITLTTPVPYDISKELWVGYSCTQIDGYFPFGADIGPAIVGFGDKITIDEIHWNNLSDYGMAYNWNIQAYVEDSSGRKIQITDQDNRDIQNFLGFNLYRSLNGGEFTFLTMLIYVEGQIEYVAPIEADGNMYCYKLTAVYESDTDFCESAPFTTLDDPDIDYVCLLLTGYEKKKVENASLINLFPNPTTSQLNIESEEEMQQISLVNAYGQVVLTKQAKGNKVEINTSNLQDGVYVVKIETEIWVINKKIVIEK